MLTRGSPPWWLGCMQLPESKQNIKIQKHTCTAYAEGPRGQWLPSKKKNFRWSLQISDVVGSRNTSWRPQPLSSELIVLTLNYVLRFFHAVCGLWVPVGPSRLLLSIFRRFCWKRRSEWLQSWQLTGKYSRIVHFPKYITSVLPKWNPNFSRLPYRLSSEVVVKDASQHI